MGGGDALKLLNQTGSPFKISPSNIRDNRGVNIRDQRDMTDSAKKKQKNHNGQKYILEKLIGLIGLHNNLETIIT